MAQTKEVPDAAAVPPAKHEKAAPGASWKANEEHVLPQNRIGIVFTGLMCCVFLAALDQVRLNDFLALCAGPYSYRRRLSPQLCLPLWQISAEAQTTAGLAGQFSNTLCTSDCGLITPPPAPTSSPPPPFLRFMASSPTSQAANQSSMSSSSSSLSALRSAAPRRT
jgi:hypothetical protein